MTENRAQITRFLRQLHMPTIRGSYEDMAGRAGKESWSYEQYLLELLQPECDTRFKNRIGRNLRNSKLPPSETFDNFDKKRLPARVTRHLHALPDGSFLDRFENILTFGNPLVS